MCFRGWRNISPVLHTLRGRNALPRAVKWAILAPETFNPGLEDRTTYHNISLGTFDYPVNRFSMDFNV